MSEIVDSFLFTKSSFSQSNFHFTEEHKTLLKEKVKILVVGAGGLGCEIMKNMALLGIRNFDVVDMDTIELTNLNRQFLFRKEDIGKYKAQVAKEKIETLFPHTKIQAYTESVQNLLKQNPSFYNSYLCIIAGLDNIEARKFLNQVIFELAKKDLHSMFIDGGTEGHMGQVRVISPDESNHPCYQCVLNQLPIIQETLPLCTLQGRPRQPEHIVLSVDAQPDASMDDASFYNSVIETGDKWGIDMRVYSLFALKSMKKRIIPAVSSCNSVIAGICCNEALKWITGCREGQMFQWYGGESGVYMHKFGVQKQGDCKICATKN